MHFKLLDYQSQIIVKIMCVIQCGVSAGAGQSGMGLRFSCERQRQVGATCYNCLDAALHLVLS